MSDGGISGTAGLLAALLGTGGITAVVTGVVSGMFSKKKQTADTIAIATDTAREVLESALVQTRTDNIELRAQVKELRAENSELWKRVTALEKAGS